MSYTAYPAADDLTAFLAATGLAVPSTLDLQAKCDAAAAEWEQRVGWNPYLTTDSVGTPSTRLFDPPGPLAASGRTGATRGGRTLYLSGGLLSLASLAIGVVPDDSGDYAGGDGTQGTVLVNNLNFILRPQNAPARGLAYTEVEFLTGISGVPQSVAVAGVWGRVAALPADVWQAVLQRAAALCAPQLGLSLSGGVASVKTEATQVAFGAGAGPLAGEATAWTADFNALARRKRRIVA